MPFKSPYPNVDIPDTDLWSLLFDRDTPICSDNQDILTDSETGKTYTFGDVRSLSISVGSALRSNFPLKRGSHVGFFTPNNVDTGVLTMATLWAGAVACPANPLYTVGELVHQFQDAKIELVFTIKELLPTVMAAAKQAAGLGKDRIILMGDGRDSRFKHWTDLKSTGTVTKEKVEGSKDHSFIVYSSGTTGLPKGVLLTHRNVIANLVQIQVFDWRYFDSGKDKTLGILPFFHIYGLVTTLLGSMFAGIQVIIMSRFDLECTCRLIQDHHITVIFVPPPIILALAKSPIIDKYDLSSLRWLNSGAAPLTRELAEGVWDRLRIGTKQGFGLSESAPVVSLQQPEEWGKFVGSVGAMVPNMEGMIVDEDNNEVKDGETGELLIKGPNVFSGYLNLEKFNSEIFYKGYFRTGDIVYKNRHEMIYVTDRAKELIKYKGYQVAPAELEGILLARPDIIDVCVIGVIDHGQATEVPRAYIVLHPGTQPSDALAKDISEWLAAKVAPYKKLRGGIRWAKEIPKSSAGKILRRVIKEEAKKEDKVARL